MSARTQGLAAWVSAVAVIAATVLGATWHLSSRLASLEVRVAALERKL